MPGEKESLHLSNALRSFEWWRRHLDNILLVDNQQFERRLDFGEPIHRLYQRINDNLTQSLITILNAGEVRPAPQEVFNSSEIIETLGTGGDVSTIGHESLQIKLKTRFWEEGVEPSANQLERIIRSSADPRALTFPCDVSGARSASLITRGRPEHLYSQAIQKGKAFLEEVVKATNVRYGDYPDRGSKFLSATTILSKINDFTRLDQMRQRVAALT
jgi:cell division GTPase FtsZ